MNAVFFYVQHLFGIGHLRRSIAIANSIASTGATVHLASGGDPVANLLLHDNIEFIQLPPVRARDGDFSTLVDGQNRPVDEQWWSHRKQCLHRAWMNSRAPILLTESYPFARRVMRHELLPLLEASRQQDFSQLNVCSVRDIPQPKHNVKRAAEVGNLLNQYYDHVLIHGDERISTLGETFPAVVAECQNLLLHYTGYVDTESKNAEPSPDTSDVLVSAGGGAAGLHVYQAALEAARIDNKRRWRLLVGHNISDADYENLRLQQSDNAVLERNRPDFRSLLKATTVSLSQAGYNTVVDVLRTGVASVLVPYAKEGEEEQSIRAGKFEAFGRAVVLHEHSIDPSSLLHAVQRARQLKNDNRRSEVSPLLNGADKSAELVDQWLERLSRPASL